MNNNEPLTYKCPKIKYFNQTSSTIITVEIEELHNKTWVKIPNHIVIFTDTLTIKHKETTHKFNSLAQLMQHVYNI